MLIDTERIKPNSGQIPGLPANPRKISRARLQSLERSIVETPEMLNLREVIVVRHGDEYVIIGGHMRFLAMQRLGYKQIQCKVLPEETPAEVLSAICIKDNGSAGEWDLGKLAADWSAFPSVEWAGDIAGIDGTPKKHKCVIRRREGVAEKCCDITEPKIGYRRCKNVGILSVFKSNTDGEGLTLSDVKKPENVTRFTLAVVDMLRDLLHLAAPSAWCIIAAPPRRHKDWNFAQVVAKSVATYLGVAFYDNLRCRTSSRIWCAIDVDDGDKIVEPNVILFDDITTTGTMMQACHKALACLNKNILCVAGIGN